jgi:UDP-glucose 4-epimerase
MDYVAVRYSNVYGPRQDPHGEAGVVAIFSTRLLRGEPLTVYGDGEQTRDYVFVGDVVAANMLLTDHPLEGVHGLDRRAFNVATGEETSVNRLARLMMEAAGREVEIRYADARPGELRHSCLDTTRLRALGWAPRTSLLEGLAQTYRFIESQGKGR